MKRWPVLLLVLSLGLLAQERRPKPIDWVHMPDHGKRSVFRITGHLVHKSGPVEILSNAVVETKIISISADEMEYNQETLEIQPRGNVRIKLN